MSDKETRIIGILQAAYNTYKDNPVVAKLMAAQAMLESGAHKAQPSELAQHNNFFGIKWSPTLNGEDDKVVRQTKEVVGGKTKTVKATFATFDTPEEGFEGHARVLRDSRYAAVRNAKDFDQAAQAVKKAGYATATNYPELLIGIYNSNIAPYWDKAMQALKLDAGTSAAPKENPTLTKAREAAGASDIQFTDANMNAIAQISGIEPIRLALDEAQQRSSAPTTLTLSAFLTEKSMSPMPAFDAPRASSGDLSTPPTVVSKQVTQMTQQR